MKMHGSFITVQNKSINDCRYSIQNLFQHFHHFTLILIRHIKDDLSAREESVWSMHTMIHTSFKHSFLSYKALNKDEERGRRKKRWGAGDTIIITLRLRLTLEPPILVDFFVLFFFFSTPYTYTQRGEACARVCPDTYCMREKWFLQSLMAYEARACGAIWICAASMTVLWYRFIITFSCDCPVCSFDDSCCCRRRRSATMFSASPSYVR